MTGENFKRLNRNTQIKELKDQIYNLQNECGKLHTEGRNTGNFNGDKYYELSKQIDWLEYLLWGAREGIVR